MAQRLVEATLVVVHTQTGWPQRPPLPLAVEAVPAGSIQYPGLPPHTPYLGLPAVFPPGQRPVSFFPFWLFCKWKESLAESAKLSFRFTTAKHFFRFAHELRNEFSRIIW
jgi:hypothetical protein